LILRRLIVGDDTVGYEYSIMSHWTALIRDCGDESAASAGRGMYLHVARFRLPDIIARLPTAL
jgi:hypothetical protein